MRTLCAWFVLVLACSLAGVCAAAPAEEVAAGAVAAYHQVADYTATVTVHGPDRDEVVRVAAMPPGSFRAEYDDPSLHHGAALAVLSEGSAWWHVPPQCSMGSTGVEKPLDGDYMAAGIAALSTGRVTSMHEAVLDGRTVPVVDVVPVGAVDPFPPDTARLSISIDRETMLVLCVEGYDCTGALVRSAEYRNLRVNAGLPEDTFAFGKPKGVWERVPPTTSDFLMNLAFLLANLVIIPIESFLALRIWLSLGYRRVTQKNILDNATRCRVYQAILDNPGIHREKIALITRTHPGTLRYHLAVLRQAGKIAVEQTGGCCRYYENNGRYSERERTVLAALWNSTRREILTVLLQTPGLSRQEIAVHLGISGPAVSRHMDRLQRDGIVEKSMNGRAASFAVIGESGHDLLGALHILKCGAD
ncbi:MAG: winged helix-turn-helix transcriptional regulator [Methanofollis sp.]|uniref:winged helix-turn-helix transcriptional regulator n=1 Tax=Methanofollis sp. TaxID=2052835 RepID=UPI002634C5ED|nr:winged helix-turn-helix transcriptional regulator [Methanofollis sp.]MDD4254390.1 winged helix-turn-helix transcriptional regulator [Methanofollis sp.]